MTLNQTVPKVHEQMVTFCKICRDLGGCLGLSGLFSLLLQNLLAYTRVYKFDYYCISSLSFISLSSYEQQNWTKQGPSSCLPSAQSLQFFIIYQVVGNLPKRSRMEKEEKIDSQQGGGSLKDTGRMSSGSVGVIERDYWSIKGRKDYF